MLDQRRAPRSPRRDACHTIIFCRCLPVRGRSAACTGFPPKIASSRRAVICQVLSIFGFVGQEINRLPQSAQGLRQFGKFAIVCQFVNMTCGGKSAVRVAQCH